MQINFDNSHDRKILRNQYYIYKKILKLLVLNTYMKFKEKFKKKITLFKYLKARPYLC